MNSLGLAAKTLSEQGKFDTLFLVSNEEGREETLEELKKVEQVGLSVLGVSGLHALDIASTRKGIKEVFLFDLAESVAHFWEDALPILAACENRESALERFKERLSSPEGISHYFGAVCKVYPDSKPEDGSQFYQNRLDEEIEKGISFLSDETRYQRIHELAAEGKIHFELADLGSEIHVDRIVDYFKNKNTSFDVIYLSNVFDCLSIKKKKHFNEFIGKIRFLDRNAVSHLVLSISGRGGTVQNFSKGKKIQVIQESLEKKESCNLGFYLVPVIVAIFVGMLFNRQANEN